MYEGGVEDFSVSGKLHTEREISYKNDPDIEAKKRLNMAYLLASNPEMFETIRESKGYFFHGTNANSIPSILKHGINSVNKSRDNGITVSTGETWSRINGGRNFVSLTDDLATALGYAAIEPSQNAEAESTLLNFGVIIGTSLEDMSGIKTCTVDSDLPEVGIRDNLPLKNIKFLAVPKERVEFVRKMVGEGNIKVVSFDMDDRFYQSSCLDCLMDVEQDMLDVISFREESVKKVVDTRRISRINNLIETIKTRLRKTIHKEHDREE